MTFAIGDRDLPGLSKVTEEAGELLQVVGKLMATHGMAEHWDGTNLRERFVLELGDLAAAVQFVITHALTDAELRMYRARVREKFEKFMQWHDEQGAVG